MTSKTSTYGKDLPGNLGTEGLLRAIYDKIDDGQSSGRIEEKLDIIFDELVNVNNNIETNTLAIKDISINVDIHTKDILSITEAINQLTEAIKNIQVHIDTSDLSDSVQLVAVKVEDGFVKTIEAIKSIQPGPTPPVPPRPVPPCSPHPHPCPEPEPIFYPVPIGLPGPTIYFEPETLEEPYDAYYCCDYPTFYNYKAGYKPKRDKSKCEYNHNKPKLPKVFVPEEARPHYYNRYDKPHIITYDHYPTPPKRVN